MTAVGVARNGEPPQAEPVWLLGQNPAEPGWGMTSAYEGTGPKGQGLSVNVKLKQSILPVIHCILLLVRGEA